MASPILINRRTGLILALLSSGLMLLAAWWASCPPYTACSIFFDRGNYVILQGHVYEDRPIAYGAFFELDGMVIPIHGGDQLTVAIGLEAPPELVVHPTHEFHARHAQLRALASGILAEHSAEDLASLAYRPALKAELLAAMNGALQETEIHRLYFTRYILK